MNQKAEKFLCIFTIVLSFVLASHSTWAQEARVTISGTVTDMAGEPVPSAKVSAKNVNRGETSQAQSDASGHYSIANLAPGDYEITASGEGVGTNSSKMTLTAGEQTVNLSLAGHSPSQGLPNARLRALRLRPRAARPRRRWRIWDSPRPSSRAMRNDRPCSISGRTCSRFISAWG